MRRWTRGDTIGVMCPGSARTADLSAILFAVLLLWIIVSAIAVAIAD